MRMLSNINLNELNARLEKETTVRILEWAWSTFKEDKLAATSSFQSQSLPLLHMISKAAPELTVFFIDTGFHFPETLVFRDRLALEMGLNIKVLKPEIKSSRIQWQSGELYQKNPDLCCRINKVKPLQEAKKKLNAWITGIRRDQTETRENVPIISIDGDGLYKICPMATWTRDDIWSYINEHELQVHPLFSHGYLSIGCAPCTRPVFPGEEERDGRWPEYIKSECGLHIPIKGESVDS